MAPKSQGILKRNTVLVIIYATEVIQARFGEKESPLEVRDRWNQPAMLRLWGIFIYVIYDLWSEVISLAVFRYLYALYETKMKLFYTIRDHMHYYLDMYIK